MPFLGLRDEDTVVSEEVEDDAEVSCLECGGVLRVRRSHERDGSFVARHFYHPGGGPRGPGGCSGGESDQHRRMKWIVLSKVKHLFPCQEAGVEEKIGRNIADVYAHFEEPVGQHNVDKIAIEVQHKNREKDLLRVTKEYLYHRYHVCWVDQDDFNGKDVDLRKANWYHPGASGPPDSWWDLESWPPEDFVSNGFEEDMAIPDQPGQFRCLKCPSPGRDEAPTLRWVKRHQTATKKTVHRSKFVGGGRMTVMDVDEQKNFHHGVLQCPICDEEYWFDPRGYYDYPIGHHLEVLE